MFCPKCGYKNPDDARFCGKCGEMLPVIDEEYNDQSDGAAQPTEIMQGDASEAKQEVVHNSYATERVSSRTTHQEEATKVPEMANQSEKAGQKDETEGMNANAGSWRVPSVDQGNPDVRNTDPAARQNPYYIPPAEVLNEGIRQQENEEPENNTALIILIIVLITLIILVGIFAFAYMNGILDI